MKKHLIFLTGTSLLLLACGLLSAGCSSGGTATGTATAPEALQTSSAQLMPGQQTIPGQQVPIQPVSSSPYVGTWVHTYEYFGTNYHTTLVINADGTAVFYNEEAELGNFSASWQDTGTSLSLQRSDGVQSVCTVAGNILTEQSYENGSVYTAEYVRS